MGMNVLEVGPMPTPAVAHLTKSMGADCGIMITASHNPSDDNGIKIFSADGFKLPDDVESRIEHYILESERGNELQGSRRIGKAYRIDDARGRYIEFAKSSIKNHSLKGIKAVLDCANGAAYSIAPLILRELGAEVIDNRRGAPDGLNINAGLRRDASAENIGRLKLGNESRCRCRHRPRRRCRPRHLSATPTAVTSTATASSGIVRAGLQGTEAALPRDAVVGDRHEQSRDCIAAMKTAWNPGSK